MPTPKQVRFHYARVVKAHDALQAALNDAHRAGVIDYPDDKFSDEAPCKTHWQTWGRNVATTERQLANAMRTEILRNR